MATLAGCLCLGLTLWMVGSRPSASIESRSILSGSWWGSQASVGIRKAGRQHWDARNFSAAERLYQAGYPEALRHHDSPAVIRYLSSIAGCRFAQFRYWDALELYLKARRLAESIQDREELGAIAFNLSSLHMEIWDFDAALRA